MTDPPEPEPDPAPRKRIETAAYALATALIALVSSGVGLVFDLFPGWRPDPRVQRSAEVAVVAVEPGVEIGSWLTRTATSDAQLRRERTGAIREAGYDPQRASPAEREDALTQPGTVFFVQTKVEGLKRDRVALHWSIYRRNGRRVRDPSLHDREAATVRLDAPTDRFVIQVWTPEPTTDTGPFFARFELRDRGGVALAVADSRPFR